MNTIDQNYPQLMLERKEGENSIRNILTTKEFSKSGTQLVIPVIFHILYNSPAQNIPDARIFAQLDVLNKDFARMNDDTANIDSVFLSVASATNYQFCLATQTPAGAPTTGILRIPFTGSFPSTPTIYSAEWDHLHYLNIYTGDLIPGMFGYAIIPPSFPGADHVVIDYETVGSFSNPGTMFNYSYGRVGTHEVAHWFGIRHTFNDSCVGLTADSCDLLGDYVCDTPPAGYPHFGCPFNHPNSCIEQSPFPPPYTSDMPDMHQNFVDYTNDLCRNFFSAGQAARMDAVIYQHRSDLMFSQGCMPLSVNNQELLSQVTIYPNPSAGSFNVSLPPSLTEIKLTLYNMYGENLFSTLVKSDSNTSVVNMVNLDEPVSGTYFLHIGTNNGSAFKKIFVLN